MMDLEKRLRTRGYRVTPQREALYRILLENEGRPMSPEDVHGLALKKHSGLGLTTIYRNMELFCELGLANRVHLHGESKYYEVNTGKHHHHMVCNSCGSVELLDACVIDELVEMVRDDSDFLVISHCMSLFGYCSNCMESKKVR
jgi:Fur family ferric uptake transcriptional regulator